MSSPNEENVAYHEAGHAVLAYLIGRRIDYVTIVPNDDSLGHAKTSGIGKKSYEIEAADYWNYAIRKLVDGDLMLHYAGQIAETHHSGKTAVGSLSDDETAINMGTYVTGSEEELDAYLHWLFIRTEKLICFETNWPLVEAVAKELLSVKKMSGRRARKIIQEARNAYFTSWKASHTPKIE